MVRTLTRTLPKQKNKDKIPSIENPIKEPDPENPHIDMKGTHNLLPLFMELLSSDGYWPISKFLTHYLGSIEKAAFLSELIAKHNYFATRGELVDGEWFYLIYDKISSTLLLPIGRIRLYVKQFIKLGIIDIKTIGIPSKQYYKINEHLITELLRKSLLIPRPTEMARSIPTEMAMPYNNKRRNNKESSSIKDNIPYGSISLTDEGPSPPEQKKQTSNFSDPIDYSHKVQTLFQHWQDLSIVKHHRPSKGRDHGLQQLNRFLHHYSMEDIQKSMSRYKQLLDDEFSILTNESPYKVGLSEFFGFADHTKMRIKKNYSKLHKVKSWFMECCQEDLSHLMKMGKDTYPHITQALKKEYIDKVGPIPNSTQNENTFRKASKFLMDFHSNNKDKLTLQLQKKPGIFAKCLIEYMNSVQTKNGGKHPGWLCGQITWTIFPKWLEQKGYIDTDFDILGNYR